MDLSPDSSPENSKSIEKIGIVFVGNISVGKTSIINRYLKDIFVEDYAVSIS